MTWAASGAVVLLLGVLLFPIFAQHKSSGPSGVVRNMKLVLLGAEMYSSDYDERLPPARAWCDAFSKYLKPADLHDPRRDGEFGFAMNAEVTGARLDNIVAEPNLVAFFSSRQNCRNAFGGSRDLNFVNRVCVLGHTDGHVSAKSQELAVGLIWRPRGSP